jgi:hypothetical protein
MPLIPAFDVGAFERLGRCATEKDSINCLSPQVDRLIHILNGLPCCQRLTAFRERWATNRSTMGFFADRPFGDVDYIHGDRGHWYIYHRGGRWEPQFNIGMFGAAPGGRRYLRIGVGFSLTLNSRDPDRIARLQGLSSLFCVFQTLLRGPEREKVRRLLHDQRHATLERDGAIPDASIVTPEGMIEWTAALTKPSGWVFLGTRLHADDDADRDLLSTWPALMDHIREAFTAWEPIWYRIWEPLQ